MIYKLGDICDIFDGPHATPPETSSGPVFLGIKNISEQCELDFTDVKHLSESDYAIWTKRVIPQEDDIVFSYEATLNRYALIPNGFYGCLGRRLAIARVKDKSIVNPHYLYHYFCSPKWKAFILANKVVGSTVLRVSVEEFPEYEVDLPDITIQNSVAQILDVITEKRDNNNAICSNLEAMAKLLYDYWFVQFDFPDENGKPYKSSGGKMVWNEDLKREIPAGWEVKPLSAFIADSKNGDWGNDKPKRKDDIEVTCFRGADFASITDDYHVTAPIRYISANNSDRLLSDGDLVTEISGGSPTQATGRVGYINQKFLDRNGGKMDCSNFCKAFTPMKCFYQYWLYQTWKAFYDAGVMFNYESKTTGIKNLMFDEFITWVRVPAPSDELLKKYQEVCSQYYDKIQEEFIESTQLASLRDFLLPMLMNGQVKVG